MPLKMKLLNQFVMFWAHSNIGYIEYIILWGFLIIIFIRPLDLFRVASYDPFAFFFFKVFFLEHFLW